MTLKPWREIAVPHEDVLKGTFQQAEFAADITRVHDGSAAAEYSDPVLFFDRTFITEGMRLLLESVAQRLAGKGGDPVIQLQTAFGGGKTHTMLAVMHMAGGKADASALRGIPEILDRVGVMTLPKARIAVLDGIRLSPSQSRKVDGHEIRTLWGELAWQLGGADAYAKVVEADRTGTSPGKDVLAELLRHVAPVVILIDELVAYIRQFEAGKTLAGGSFDSNLTFVQALTEAMKAVPNGVLLASLPESEQEAGGGQGVAALKALEHYFGRVQAVWKTVGKEEAFEIVRRRLFAEIRDRAAANESCRAFAEYYVANAGELPSETQEASYYDRMTRAYPIHPEVFERLYSDWSSLPNFQRTRGVLKLMAKVINRLWQSNNQDVLLMPGSLPLAESTVISDLTTYLPTGWDPVIDHDVDGDGSEPAEIEQKEPKFGANQACRRITRTIFLGSAPSGPNRMAQGLETERVMLGCLQPGYAPHLFKDALGRLETRLTYLNKGNGRWWLDIKPNLRREMEERKKRIDDAQVIETVRDTLQRALGPSVFSFVHYFTPAADVPDEWSIRLVVLPIAQAWSRSGPNAAKEAADAILKRRGEQPRLHQNRLLFLAAEADQVMHLKDVVRQQLAWRSIENDAKDLRLTLDNQQQRQATQNREQASSTVQRLVRETFKWLVAPMQTVNKNGEPSPIEWEAFPLNPASQAFGKELDRVVAENELVIDEWAPTHLNQLLKRWYWKDGVQEVAAVDVWQNSCNYLYFPRLLKSTVIQATIAAGAGSVDFFGLAYGKEGDDYRGFTLGKATSPLMDALLLIEPGRAKAYEERTRVPTVDSEPTPVTGGPASASTAGGTMGNPTAPVAGGASAAAQGTLTHYFGSIELDPVKGALQYSTIAQEIVHLFTRNPGATVRIKVDIEAEQASGFDIDTVRAVRENARTLSLKQSEFD
jgi:uncharacterized protein